MKPQPPPETATEKQLAYIVGLGGRPSEGLTLEEASALIDKLKRSRPPTSRQVEALRRLGATVPESLTYQQALDLLAELDRKKPPTPSQVKLIRMLGGEVPGTKEDAEQLCRKLELSAPATEQQIEQAQTLGKALADGATYAEANQFLENLERDADEDEGQPPNKTQINMIVKLGGDPAKAINNWRAEEYIEELEDKKQEAEDELESRAETVLDDLFLDADGRALMKTRKPGKKVMECALEYGDAQGWPADWEYDHVLVEVALYVVAPALLKQGESPPVLNANMRRKPDRPISAEVNAESTPCPCCGSKILIGDLREGNNKCPSCEKTFNVKYD